MQLDYPLEQFFPFPRLCWILDVLRSQQNKAGEAILGSAQGFGLTKPVQLAVWLVYAAVIELGTNLTKIPVLMEHVLQWEMDNKRGEQVLFCLFV